MASILLVGGPLDGSVRHVDSELLQRRMINFPVYAPISARDISDLPPEPVTINAVPYWVQKIEFRHPRGFDPLIVYFGWHPDLKGPDEAMIMMMQHYQVSRPHVHL